MGKLVVTEFVSLDGVFEDPGGAEDYEHGGWTFEYDRGDDGNKFKLDELMDAKVQLLGRVTYEGFAAAWPSREGPFAEKLNNDPKVVVSSTLTDPHWNNTTVISDDVVNRLRKLRDETDGSILVAGSGMLVETLLGADLVDELRLMVFPTILGRGRRVFPDGIDRLKFTLVESRIVGPDGVQVQVLRRDRWSVGRGGWLVIVLVDMRPRVESKVGETVRPLVGSFVRRGRSLLRLLLVRDAKLLPFELE